MKVLLIDVNCKQSSTGKIVYDLFSGLKGDGHKAAICYGRGEVIKEEGIYKFGYDWETNIHAGLSRLTGLNGYYSYFSTQRLIKFIDKFKPDVIHIHELHAYFINITSLIKHIKKLGIKVVWTFHCEYMYTGKCGHANKCLGYKNGCGHCPAVKEYPKSFIFDRTAKMWLDKYELLKDWNFTIVVPSQWSKDRVKSSFLTNKNIQVIYNGIDTNVFYSRSQEEIESLRKEYRLKSKKVVLAVAPNIMDQRKGGKYVIEIAKQYHDRNTQFVLVGANETKRIADNVQLIRRTKNQDELAVWYSLADVFVICSEKETFSMTCAEALCCGTRVVGFKCGAPETVFKTPLAYFVDRDISEISKFIQFILNQQSDKESISNIAKKKYSCIEMYNNYLYEYVN